MFYKILDLPPATKDWGTGFKDTNQYYGINPTGNEEITLPNGEVQSVALYERVRANFKYKAWIYSLVPELKNDRCEFGFQNISNRNNDPRKATLLPHSDGIRGPFVLSYNFDIGGSYVPTVFYQEEGQPVNRELGLQMGFNKNFREISRVVFEPNQWNVLDARPLHSVLNIETSRFAFTVGFYDENIFEIIKEKYAKK